MLNKTAVEFFWGITALGPVEHKFGHGLFDKAALDTTAQHDFHCIFAWLPMAVEYGRRCCLLCCALRLGLLLLLVSPGMDNALAELVLPGVTDFIALTPVKDEILSLLKSERAGYVVIEGQ